MITTTWSWPADSYDHELPPPLCFTVPAGQLPGGTSDRINAHGAMVASMRQPKLMMDPSDRSTWQRPYLFGATGNLTVPPPRTPGPGTPRLICIPPDAMT
jgi:hypothetical protein